MAGITTAYSFNAVQVTIDGDTIDGFWEGDDAVTIERNTDNITPIVGADGAATVSISADDSVTITLRLQPNSPGNEILQRKFLKNRSFSAAAFPVSIRDTGNGEGGSAPYCVVQQRPNVSLGDNASVREWTIFANPWRETEIDYI